jgi:serine/threonine-protein kinase RsbW
VYLWYVEEFHFTLPVDAAFLASLRHELGTWLETVGFDDRQRDDLVLATHEAAANAIEHGAPSDPVWVDAFFLGGEITVEVHDNGEWKTSQEHTEERGRGLMLAERLVSHVEILTDEQGTTLRLLCPGVPD